MKVKLFEVRDSGTFIPVMAVLIQPMRPEVCREGSEQRERYLMRRAGYGYDSPLVLLTYLNPEYGGKIQASFEPFTWQNGRTMQVAHEHIQANWSTLQSGEVIDVQFILGETKTPKPSEELFDSLVAP